MGGARRVPHRPRTIRLVFGGQINVNASFFEKRSEDFDLFPPIQFTYRILFPPNQIARCSATGTKTAPCRRR